MWFADAGVRIAAVLLVVWLGVSVAVLLPATGVARVGASGRFRPAGLPLVLGTGAGAGLLLAQAALVDQVADHPAGIGIDLAVLDWFVAYRDTAATAAATTVSDLGGTLGMSLVAAAAVLGLWWRSRIADALAMAIATVGAGVLVVGFKALYARPRPPLQVRLAVETNASLPSGHALASMVVLGMLAFVAVRGTCRTTTRVLAPALVAVMIAAIGGSRLYLGVHWLTDVLVAWLLGGAWLALCATALAVARTPPAPLAAAPAPHPPDRSEVET